MLHETLEIKPFFLFILWLCTQYIITCVLDLHVRYKNLQFLRNSTKFINITKKRKVIRFYNKSINRILSSVCKLSFSNRKAKRFLLCCLEASSKHYSKNLSFQQKAKCRKRKCVHEFKWAYRDKQAMFPS